MKIFHQDIEKDVRKYSCPDVVDKIGPRIKKINYIKPSAHVQLLRFIHKDLRVRENASRMRYSEKDISVFQILMTRSNISNLVNCL